MLTGLVCAVLVALLYPETPIGKWLTEQLIERPARRASGITSAKLLRVALFALALVTTFLAAKVTEYGIPAAQAVPEMFAYLATVDVTATLELTAAFWLMAGSRRLWAAVGAGRLVGQAALHRLRAPLGAVLARMRSRSRRTRPAAPRPRKGDDDARPAWEFAFA